MIYQKQYLGKRKQQEDSIGYFKDGKFETFIVCDGMGGYKGGALASQIAVKEFSKINPKNDFQQEISAAQKRIIDKYYEIVSKDFDLASMGTTAIVVVKDKETNKIKIATIGDSYVFLFNETKINFVNVLHQHPFYTNMVTRCLTPDYPNYQFDFYELDINDNDILIATDGIDYLSPTNQPTLDILINIEKQINEALLGDNLSFIKITKE